MTFGEKVKAERTKLGITQEELAAKVGVTVRVICSYENDKSRPRGTERYKKLAEALDVKWLTLFRKLILSQRKTIKNTLRRNIEKTNNLRSELSPYFGTSISLLFIIG